MTIKLKRIYEEPETSDGIRILVERLWPRGLSKEKAKVDIWLKDAAPSTELRKWFGHDPEKWEEFKKRYYNELLQKERLLKDTLEDILKENITFVYASKEEEFNNAVALKEYVEKVFT
ncbi:MAG: DUF488 domain-containing protein [Thermodesulfobacteriales bacterium]|jgi:uncharacterized protein YeaO (DUF488 family)|nr:MAG: DUF488 domain-containing protein [Thermodesulfobacteriales bacterium]